MPDPNIIPVCKLPSATDEQCCPPVIHHRICGSGFVVPAVDATVTLPVTSPEAFPVGMSVLVFDGDNQALLIVESRSLTACTITLRNYGSTYSAEVGTAFKDCIEVKLLGPPLTEGVPDVDCSGVVDVALVIDESCSIDDLEWAEAKDFINELANDLDDELADPHYNVTLFAAISNASTLVLHSISSSLSAALGSLNSYTRPDPCVEATETAEGMRLAVSDIADNGRDNAQRVMIVVTDGVAAQEIYQGSPGCGPYTVDLGTDNGSGPNLSESVEDVADAARALGFTIFMITVGFPTSGTTCIPLAVLEQHIINIAGDEERVFDVSDFNAAREAVELIVEGVCG